MTNVKQESCLKFIQKVIKAIEPKICLWNSAAAKKRDYNVMKLIGKDEKIIAKQDQIKRRGQNFEELRLRFIINKEKKFNRKKSYKN